MKTASDCGRMAQTGATVVAEMTHVIFTVLALVHYIDPDSRILKYGGSARHKLLPVLILAFRWLPTLLPVVGTAIT